MAAVAITQAFAGITLRGSSAGKVATTPISAKAHFGGVRALGKSAFARTAKAQRLQIRAEAEDESAPEAPAAPVASTDEGDAPRPRGTFPHQRFADSLLPNLAHAQSGRVAHLFFSRESGDVTTSTAAMRHSKRADDARDGLSGHHTHRFRHGRSHRSTPRLPSTPGSALIRFFVV